MGMFNKIKGILFEEIEDEEVVENQKEKKKPIAEKIEPRERQVREKNDNVIERKEVNEKKVEVVKNEVLSERELYNQPNTFSFPDFDEEEFMQVNRNKVPKSSNNVLEYEKKKRLEKKYDYGKSVRIERTEVIEKKKFKPSPIISPVYGILNEDYRPEDIKLKNDINYTNDISFEEIRRKAFETPKKAPVSSKFEETVTVKLKEDEEEKKQKVKTIDELLEDTSDITIEIPSVREEYRNQLKDDNDEIDITKEMKVEEPVVNDDEIENDLFELIDSMYDNKEDGE